ncbi:hypothetical protein [Nonomuraea dietziae]
MLQPAGGAGVPRRLSRIDRAGGEGPFPFRGERSLVGPLRR